MGPLWEELAATHIRTQVDAGGVCCVTVTGDIDLLTAPELKRALHEVAARGCRHAVVDLTGVPYMDSSGYGALLSGVKHLRPVEGQLYLVGCSSTVRRMLDVTRLGTLFSICSTLDEARAAIVAAGSPYRVRPHACRQNTPATAQRHAAADA